MYKSSALANIAIVETVIKEFSNVPLKHKCAFAALVVVQEAELENPFAVVSLSAVSSVRLDLSVEGVPGSALPSAIALMICTRSAVVAAALINVIRRRAAN
jgi:hypothetical protein